MKAFKQVEADGLMQSKHTEPRTGTNLSAVMGERLFPYFYSFPPPWISFKEMPIDLIA